MFYYFRECNYKKKSKRSNFTIMDTAKYRHHFARSILFKFALTFWQYLSRYLDILLQKISFGIFNKKMKRKTTTINNLIKIDILQFTYYESRSIYQPRTEIARIKRKHNAVLINAMQLYKTFGIKWTWHRLLTARVFEISLLVTEKNGQINRATVRIQTFPPDLSVRILVCTPRSSHREHLKIDINNIIKL